MKKVKEETKMEKQVDCGSCGGDGYVERWDESEKLAKWIVSDCENCNGKGTVTIEVVDNRIKSIGIKLDYPKEY